MVIKHRKASLQLSINAIVILILGITILGLGLGFVRNQFTNMEDQFGQVNRQMQEQVRDQIEKSGSLLAFNLLELEIKRGDELSFYYGIRNTDAQPGCFNTVVRCLSPYDSASYLDGDGASISCTSTTDFSSGGTAANLFKVSESVFIRGGETEVLRGFISLPKATPDTYNFVMQIYKASSVPTSAADCDPATASYSNTITDPVYAEETFYVTVTG